MRAFGGNDAAAAAEQRFADWTSTIERALAPGERYTATCAGEATDFARMNRGKVRQAGSVLQNELSIRLVRGARHADSRHGRRHCQLCRPAVGLWQHGHHPPRLWL